ncbi:hypothetical protein CCP3SC5AM1_500001 [Gammaproteobacteria bacterium]
MESGEQFDLKHGLHIDYNIHKGILMSTQPASDRALRGALSLPGINARASRAIRVKIYETTGYSNYSLRFPTNPG